MADGSKKPIEDVKVGDEVLATDPETGEQAPKKVEHVFVHHDTVIDLIVDGEVITTTEDHPFWSVTDQRFDRADQLQPGDRVLSASGEYVKVQGLQPGTMRADLAYNLSVEGIHTYHVGHSEVLVHNECPDSGDWAVVSGIIRDAAKGKGNFGLGSGSSAQARTAGETWVGEGFRVASDGKTLVSADGLRVYRPPTWKPRLGIHQANFEYWTAHRSGLPHGNGHLVITDLGGK